MTLKRIKTLLKQLLAYIPGKLPQTDNALEVWIEDICEIADFPLNDSTRHAVATCVMHISMPKMWVAKQTIATELQRSKANQAAWNLIQDTKGRAKANDAPSVS